ncbi:hypothetical protein LTR37_003716 [Vermiconidia calcicola]|uniref:Uncharacterized protein n=1 Tax=Vermiconidia calcicola TaxID=1690605 RepID=A0ACC3NPT1_9PEZI|nr:hypothetical protein LTR37_003716 [Vermiconidia calcicola]
MVAQMFRGQKFEVDLGEEDEKHPQNNTTLPGAFVGDVLERKPTAPKPPSAPALKNKSGFPEHRKRNVESKFKQRKTADHTIRDTEKPSSGQDGTDEAGRPAVGTMDSGKAKTWEEEERERIDSENRQKLAQMSTQEIEEERQELVNSLGPELLQRLLKRSNIASGSTESDLSNRSEPATELTKPKSAITKTVTFAEPELSKEDAERDLDADHELGDEFANEDPEALAMAPLPHDSIHFPQPPQPPQPPDLDPSSDTFLKDLHEKYFPSLPTDPDKLEWMQQAPSNTNKPAKNTYDPSSSALNPKDLRFSFKGELIPPKTAAEIPVTAGLHHHGDAPDAAGYTISELVHLAHSSFAPQRCVAFQTLGRLLYRLGRGEFGDAGEPGAEMVGAEDTFGELARGLWREVEREKVIEMLVRESEGRGVDGGRHVSAKAYATEAVWLWRKGGGRRWKAD